MNRNHFVTKDVVKHVFGVRFVVLGVDLCSSGKD